MWDVNPSAVLLKNGSLLVLAGLCWGTMIQSTPHPRIALSTHMTLLQHGMLNIAAGLILNIGAIELNGVQMWIVTVPHLILWAVHVIGVANASWGADKAVRMVREEKDESTPKRDEPKGWQQKLAAFVYIIVLWLIPAWMIIVAALLRT